MPHRSEPLSRRLPSPLRCLALVVALAGSLPAQTIRLDPELAPYRPVQGVSGSIKSIGSDTMTLVMTLWTEGFLRHYPNVQVEVEGKGSSTAPPALIQGTSNFGPMSRPMKKAELQEFEKQHGYAPVALPTSLDLLVIYVHKDNPLRSLTLAQVDAVFGQHRNGGHPRDVRSWGDLGLTGSWARQPISLYGRNSASGTYGHFKQYALFDGDFKRTVKEQPGSAAVVQGVASDRHGIGYTGIGYLTADVRALALAEETGDEPVPATTETAYSGAYPLARPLVVYVNHEPNTELDPLRREFIRYVFSRDGQRDVIKAGYFPITAALAQRALASVGLPAADDG